MINLNESKINNRLAFQDSPIEHLSFNPGIWVDGKSIWLQNRREKIIYEDQIILKVKQEQIHSKIKFSHLYISNHSNRQKSIKILVMHHLYQLSHDSFSFVSPKDQVVFHISDQEEMFMINGSFKGKGMEHYTIQPYWNVITNKIWSSLHKGDLAYRPLAKGPAASILAVDAVVQPKETVKLNTWSIKGKNKKELMALDRALLKNTLAFPFEK